MSAGQRIHLYCLAWNEATILPFFLRHYADLVDRFHVLDNGSTDATLSMLAGDPRIRVRPFTVRGDSFVAEEQRLSELMWQHSRGIADWVIVIDIDELLYHPDFRGYLKRCTEGYVTAIRAVGYDMVADGFPPAGRLLHREATRGARSINYDKACLFDPNAIVATNFQPGRHSSAPTGAVRWPEAPEVALLHYKYVGREYLRSRTRLLATGLGPGDLARNWGLHYQRSDEQLDADFTAMQLLAEPVPGLAGGVEHLALAHEEDMIRRSGVFDPGWYLREYPDVARADHDPVAHFHLYGWREGRRPSRDFDLAGYVRRNAGRILPGMNPLVDFLQRSHSGG